MEEGTPIQITTKNPKKVEAGKRLAEYNRKQREKLKQLESKEKELEKESKVDSEAKEKIIVEEKVTDGGSTSINYELLGLIGIVSIGGITYYYFNKNKNDEKPKKKKKIVVEDVKPVEKKLIKQVKQVSKFDME